MYYSLPLHTVWRRVRQRAFTGHHSRSYCGLFNPSSEVFEDLPLVWFGEYIFCDTIYRDVLYCKYFISKVSLKTYVIFLNRELPRK